MPHDAAVLARAHRRRELDEGEARGRRLAAHRAQQLECLAAVRAAADLQALGDRAHCRLFGDMLAFASAERAARPGSYRPGSYRTAVYTMPLDALHCWRHNR